MAKKKRDPKAKVPKLKWREVGKAKKDSNKTGKYKLGKAGK
jgi:hypothetical protein